MADITIVNGAYKPTNITGGHHPVVSSKFPEQATASDSNRPFVEAEEDDVGYSIPEAWYSHGDHNKQICCSAKSMWPKNGLTRNVTYCFSLWTGCRCNKSSGCFLLFSDVFSGLWTWVPEPEMLN